MLARRERIRAFSAVRAAKRRKKHMTKEERAKMNEIIQRFIGKRCIISTIISESSSIVGTITESNDSWITVSYDDTEEIVNIDYIVHIKEYPQKKKKNK